MQVGLELFSWISVWLLSAACVAGCLLADVLRSCGIDEEKSRHLGIKHAHFEGL